MNGTDEILHYTEMCQREGTNLQRGMNYRLHPAYSVLLMSVRPNAPYRDQILDDGRIVIYEGHDEPRSAEAPDPKLADQPLETRSGSPTENAKFYQAAKSYQEHVSPPEVVRLYQKLMSGIWSYAGEFHLVGADRKWDGNRYVFKFKLEAITTDSNEPPINQIETQELDHPRIIPTDVKLAVWKRDKGRCVVCGATDELHFDHIIPYSKGGTSLNPDNIQILCARHNLAKSNKIE